jgi:hypothetical protein
MLFCSYSKGYLQMVSLFYMGLPEDSLLPSQ